jgi:hypothetical protein
MMHMPTIKLTDQVGAEINVELNDDSAIAKYIKGLKGLKLTDIKFSGLEGVTLDKVPVKSIKSGISFEQPVDIGTSGVEMKIGAGASGSIRVYSSKDKQLFDPEVFGDPIPIGANQSYVSFAMTASLSTDLTAKTGDLSFGFNAGSQVALTTYKLFEKTNGGSFPLYAEALKEAFRSFAIPGDIEDIAGMAVGAVTTVEGSGSLKFSGGVNLLTIVNPLATVNLPEPIGAVKVTSGNAIKVAASVEVSGAYQIRAQKISKSKFRLGYYKKRGSDFNLKVSASGGLSAGVGKLDLIEELLKAVSQNPQVDKDALTHGGLNDDQIEAIKKVVEAGVSRKLEIALSFELDALRSSEAAFLYEIEPGKLNQSGRQAVHDALDGNLSGLTRNENELPQGINLVRSIFTETQKQKHALKFNLLGIYNYISVSTLILKGTVMFEPATGELVITDKATATRIAASTLNFAADSEKLRKVMAESVMITAAYRCSKLVAQPPELKISHSYFELHTKTDQTAMKNNLEVLEALGLMTASEKKKILAGSAKFGRTTLYAATAYGDELISDLFLQDGSPRPREDYERAGRNALKLLIQSGDDDEIRRLPATDNNLWKEMKQQGQANFKSIDKLKGLSAPLLGAVISDYSVVVWWAQSMSEMGERLAEIRQFFKNNPNIDPENNSFKSLRKKLASKLKDVASNTREEFGDPWGLIAMDQVSGSRASARAQIMGPGLAVTKERNVG